MTEAEGLVNSERGGENEMMLHAEMIEIRLEKELGAPRMTGGVVQVLVARDLLDLALRLHLVLALQPLQLVPAPQLLQLALALLHHLLIEMIGAALKLSKQLLLMSSL